MSGIELVGNKLKRGPTTIELMKDKLQVTLETPKATTLKFSIGKSIAPTPGEFAVINTADFDSQLFNNAVKNMEINKLQFARLFDSIERSTAQPNIASGGDIQKMWNLSFVKVINNIMKNLKP